MSAIRTISTGGLGDSWIVLLKLLEKVRNGQEVYHLHLESNNIVPQLIKEYIPVIPYPEAHHIHMEAQCDVNYEKKIKNGMYEDRIFLNTSWHGNYDFPGKDSGLMTPFVVKKNEFPKRYDFCIQVSAGAKADRGWKFDPKQLATLLRNKGYSVCLIGTDDRFFDRKDKYNLVNKTNLHATMGAILSSKFFVGLSGFCVYMALSYKQPTTHVPESDDHVNHYIHPLWKPYRKEVKLGTLSEIISVIRKEGYNI